MLTYFVRLGIDISPLAQQELHNMCGASEHCAMKSCTALHKVRCSWHNMPQICTRLDQRRCMSTGYGRLQNIVLGFVALQACCM